MSNALSFFRVIVLLLLCSKSYSQNLFSNGDFEAYSNCPMGLGQASVVDGLTPCTVTPDYYNSGCNFLPSNSDGSTYCSMNAQASIPSGSGFIGFFGGLFNATQYQYESFSIDLNSPTQIGQAYEVSFSLFSVNRQFSPCYAPGAKSCLDFGFLFYSSSNPVNCPSGSLFPIATPPHPVPHMSMPCSNFIDGSWNLYTLNFVADANYDRLLIYFYPNSNTAQSSCAGSWPTPMSKLFMDDLCIKTVGGSCSTCDYAINAGNDQNICSNSSATLNAQANGGITSVSWTTSGDGSFDNSNSTNAVYTPGANDITNGSVTLTVTSNDPGLPCASVSDQITLIITQQGNPIIQNTPSVCSTGENITLVATPAGGIWSGNGIINTSTGLFSPSVAGAGISNILYTLSGSCGGSDNINLEVIQGYTIQEISDFTICADEQVDLTAITQGNPLLSWNTSGDGSFSSLNGSSTTYFPGTNDVSNAGVQLAVQTDSPSLPCTQIIEEINVSINPNSIAEINLIDPLCVLLNDFPLTVTGTQGGTWSGTGITDPISGTFSPSTAGVGAWEIMYTIPGNCGDQDQIFVIVEAGQLTNFQYDTTVFCLPGENPVPQLIGDNGGVFSISDNGFINSANGEIYLSDTPPGNYTISYSFDDACNSSSSTQIEICLNMSIEIPNVYTPNSDGVNDLFTITVDGFKSINGHIINRWGNVVAEFNDNLQGKSFFNLWDGKSKSGEAVSSGVYFYQFQLLDLNNEYHDYTGFFELFR